MTTHNRHSLSDFLFGAIPPWIIHALGKVMDESDALGYADLLFFSQLSGQASLARCRVIDGYVDLLLQRNGKNNYHHSNNSLERKKIVEV